MTSTVSAPVRSSPRAGLSGWLASGLVVAVAFSGIPRFSLIMIALLGIVAAGSLCITLRIHRYALLAIAFLILVFVFGALIGSVPETVQSLPRWLNRDGRVIAGLLPIVLLGTTRVRLPDLSMTVRTIGLVVAVNLPVFIAGVLGVPLARQIAFERFSFSGLTSSHHAAGMVFAASALILMSARAIPEFAPKPRLALVVAALVLAIGSGSRTAIVGLVLAALWLAYQRRLMSEAIRILAVVALIGTVAIVLNDKVAGTVGVLLSPELWSAAWHQFALGLGSSESAHYSGGAGGLSGSEGYVANILGRFFYWGVAISLWLRSPLVGIGSFRFNDVDLGFVGMRGFVQFATSGVDRSDSLIGAHNQYLGVMVENGIIGLAVLLCIWILPYRRIAATAALSARLQQSGRQMLPFALGTGLTGYTLVSPALTYVCLTWLMLVCFCAEDPP